MFIYCESTVNRMLGYTIKYMLTYQTETDKRPLLKVLTSVVSLIQQPNNTLIMLEYLFDGDLIFTVTLLCMRVLAEHKFHLLWNQSVGTISCYWPRKAKCAVMKCSHADRKCLLSFLTDRTRLYWNLLL